MPEAPVSPQAAALLADGQAAAGVQRARLVQRLQRAAGNAYVSRMIQRAAVADAPHEAAPQKLDPHADPKFAGVEHKLGQTARHEKQHAPARSKVREAQAAAVGPPNDVASQADAAQVDKMAQQKPGDFDKQAFIDAVHKAIEAAAPKNLEEADDFKSSDKAGQVKGQVSGLVGKGKQDSEAGIKQANTEAPDSSQAKPKQVTPMGDEQAGATPGDGGAAQAIPSPKSADETSMAAGPAQVNQEMSKAEVTEDQLKKSNEPQFKDALDAKKTAEQDSKQGPAEYKATENQTLNKSAADAKNVASSGVHAMHGERSAALGAITTHKTGAKSQDEAKRAEVAGKVESIFNKTRTDVTAILDGLDGKVNSAFDAGEKDARSQFENYVDQQMTAYKDKRYDGLLGKGRWLKDKLFGMPDEVNAFYSQGRNQYLKHMEAVISKVADLVGAELGKAKKRVADGRQQVKDYVASQPKALQQVARDAEQQMSSKFDQLDSDVASKQDALVQSLADKYVAARDALDDRINQLKAENKGLVNKAIDAVAGVIRTIMQLKDMLLNVLSRAASVIGDIIKDPIKFLGNLVGAIKQGLGQFVSNIATHLKKGLMGWLFGTLGNAGLALPDSFDLKGIVSLILQIIGLTYQNIRAIAVKIAGEKVVAAVEGTVKFFITLAKDGPAGLWGWIKDKISEINIKDMVIGAIKDFVITKIIIAGVTWLVGLLNPAAAFIKACKMIYDVIMFFIERGSQIMEFVNSILDSISSIVAGNLGAAANLVESSLAKILPLAISFLASLLGVGGIAEKIKDIIEKVRAPITKLVSAIVGPILRPLKKLYDKGAKFVTGVIDKGKALGKSALNKVKQKAGAAVGKVKSMFGGKPDKAGKPGQATGEDHKADTEGEVLKQPFSMAGSAHTLFVELHGGRTSVLMASKKGRVAGQFSMLRETAQRYREAIEQIDDPAIKQDYAQTAANLEEMINSEIAQRAATIDGMSSKDRATALSETKSLADDLMGLLVQWGNKFRLPDMSPEGVKKRVREEAARILNAKQAEVIAALQAFVPRLQALHPAAQLKIRGSLSTGRKSPDKVGPGGERLTFDANDFDVDAFIVSDDLARQALEAGAQLSDNKIWGSRCGIRAIENFVRDARVELANIPGMRRRDGRDVADFDVVIRTKRDVQELIRKQRNIGEPEKHLDVPPPPAPDANG